MRKMIFWKKVICLFICFLLLFSKILPFISFAGTSDSTAYLETSGQIDYHMMYDYGDKTAYIICHIVGWTDSLGIWHPAYCLNKLADGAEEGSYSTTISEYYNDAVWRVLKHGYGFCSPESMGLSQREAYAVTKWAIYCVTGQSDINSYIATDDTSRAMLQKLQELVRIGLGEDEVYGSETQPINATININKSGELTEENINEKEYYVQYFSITANYDLAGYNLSLNTFGGDGILLLNIANQSQTYYEGNSTVKVAIPKNICLAGTSVGAYISTNDARIASFPIYYCQSYDSSKQNCITEADPFSISGGSNLFLIKTPSVEIYKYDRNNNNALAGARWAIYKDINKNGKYDYGIDTFVNYTSCTDNNGHTSYDGLQVGSYVAVEVESPAGYNLDGDVLPFTIEINGSNINLSATDTQWVEIIKEDRDTKEKLAGAVYEIYLDKNGNSLIDREDLLVYTTEPTNASGKTSVRVALNPGQYISKEIEAPSGYNLDAENQVFVVSTKNSAVTMTSTNTKNVKITKLDRDTKEKLAGAVYDIYLDVNKNNEIDENDTLIYTTNPTDENGKTDVNISLKPGRYISTEVKAPVGYNLDDEDQIFVISTTGSAVEITSTDTIWVEITKLDRDTKKELAGAVYDIYLDKNENSIIDEEDLLVYTTEPTNLNGKTNVSVSLKPGQYISTEVEAPIGYNLDDEDQVFIISTDNTAVTITSTDTIITSEIIVVKTASTDSEITGKFAGDTLSGAIFNIYDINHKLLYENLKTDEKGKINIILKYGKYIVEEVRPPEFYLLNEKNNEQIVNVYKDGEQIILHFEDEAVKLSLLIEKSGIVQCQANDEIQYRFPTLKNSSNVSLDDFTWTDVLPTDYIRITKLYTGTYNEDLDYTIWYKTNTSEDYIQYINPNSQNGTYNTQINNYIDFTSVQNDEEYITEYKIEFGMVMAGFSTIKDDEPFIFTKVRDTIKNDDMWTNNTYLFGNYTSIDGNTLDLASKDDWTTTSYKYELSIKKLPRAGF